MRLYKPQLENPSDQAMLRSWHGPFAILGDLQRQLWPGQNPASTWYERKGVRWFPIESRDHADRNGRFLGVQLSAVGTRRRVMLNKLGEIDLDRLLAVHNELAALVVAKNGWRHNDPA